MNHYGGFVMQRGMHRTKKLRRELEWSKETCGMTKTGLLKAGTVRHKDKIGDFCPSTYIKWKFFLTHMTKKKKKPSVAFSPRANYTDWATATCWWNLVPTFVDRGVSRGQRGGSPTVVNAYDRGFNLYIFYIFLRWKVREKKVLKLHSQNSDCS
jgi:hypothetical protein